MKPKGIVYIVGAGPGDPGLITLKALDCLKKAEVVIYDRLVNPKILGFVCGKAECIYAGKSTTQHTLTQDKINNLLVKKAKQGKIVVRLKCGDPFIFGRGAEEAAFLAKYKIPFEVVPGVSSALAVAAYAGIPLTHRKYTSSLGIFTGHEDLTKGASGIDWEKITTGLGTLVFLMGVENLSTIVRNLIAYGRKKSTPCCLIQQGTLPEQKSIAASLETIPQKAKAENIQPPAILVVGEVVGLRKNINWFETQPLFGKRILITRPQDDPGNRLILAFKSYGADCREFPVAQIKALSDYSQLDQTIKNIDNFNWLIFTSQNGVKFFKQRLDFLKKDSRIFQGIKIACLGPKTALALETLGLRADFEAATFCQEGLLERLSKINIQAKNILLIRALKARDILPEGLKSLGASVTIVPAYQTVQPKTRDLERTTQDARRKTQDAQPKTHSAQRATQDTGRTTLQDIDLITFTSSSCVEGFFKIFSPKDIFNPEYRFKVASIGPVTSQTARGLGLKVDIEAKKYTFEGLVEAVVRYYKASKR